MTAPSTNQAAASDSPLSASAHDLSISRIIEAPRELVFKAFTEPGHAAQWFAPTGCTTVCEMDVRPGGTYRTVIQAPDGSEYPVKGVYREVVAPARLVFTENLSEHPAEWQSAIDGQLREAGSRLAGEYLVTVTFEEADGKTKLTLGYVMASDADRAAHEKIGWMQGYGEGFERLAAYLAAQA